MNNFDEAVDVILTFEGGYSNDPDDKGGETKYGISKKAFPDIDIKNLTRDDAKLIYKNQYWNPIQGDKLPPEVSIMIFDMAVNSGTYKAATIMQDIIKVKVDGIIGKNTLKAISEKNPLEFLIEFTVERILFYASLSSFKKYKRGWITRAICCLVGCIKNKKVN